MNLAVAFRKLYYSIFSGDAECRKKVRSLLNVKVKNPFDVNDVCTLGDIIFSTSMSEREILQIAESYGIKMPSEAADISSNDALKYLLFHNKNLHYEYIDSAGNLQIAGLEQLGDESVISDIEIVPMSHLDKLADFLQNSGEKFKQFFGHAAEFTVADKLNNLGVETYLPKAGNNPGFDLLCNKQDFFDKYGIELPAWNKNPDYGMLQVKTATEVINPSENYIVNTLNHFDKYPNIPVICSDKIANALSDYNFDNSIISFSDIGIDDRTLEEQVSKSVDFIKGFIPDQSWGDIGINQGLECSRFADDLPYSAGWGHIPLVAIGLRASISTYKNYSLYNKGAIDFQEMLSNVGRDAAETAVISTATIYATKEFATALGLPTISEAGNNLWENLSDGFDLDDIGDSVELALALAVAVGIGFCIKKAWQFVVGDPLKKLKQLKTDRKNYINDIKIVFNDNSKDILNYIIKQFNYDNICKSITGINKRMSDLEYKNKRSFEYYALEYKAEILGKVKNKQDSEISNINKIFENLNTIWSILHNCLYEEVNEKGVSKYKENILDMYRKQNDNIKESIKNIKTSEQMADCCVILILYHLKGLLQATSEMGNEALDSIYAKIQYYEQTIKEETEIQIKKGNIEFQQ
mgnify:FL=1